MLTRQGLDYLALTLHFHQHLRSTSRPSSSFVLSLVLSWTSRPFLPGWLQIQGPQRVTPLPLLAHSPPVPWNLVSPVFSTQHWSRTASRIVELPPWPSSGTLPRLQSLVQVAPPAKDLSTVGHQHGHWQGLRHGCLHRHLPASYLHLKLCHRVEYSVSMCTADSNTLPVAVSRLTPAPVSPVIVSYLCQVKCPLQPGPLLHLVCALPASSPGCSTVGFSLDRTLNCSGSDLNNGPFDDSCNTQSYSDLWTC